MTWKVGDFVRYGAGSTALCQLIAPHAGGWHATQCLGGTIFVHDNGWSNRMEPFSADDYKTWVEREKYRR